MPATVLRRHIGADFSTNAVDFIFPVSTGLVEFSYYGGDTTAALEKSLRNRARGGLADTKAGTPTINTNSLGLKAFSNYIVDNVKESRDQTIILVARSLDTQAASANRALFWATYGDDTLQGLSNVGTMFHVTAGTAAGASCTLTLWTNTNPASPTLRASALTIADLTQWNYYEVTTSDAAHSITARRTSQTTTNSTTAGARILQTNQQPRTGSGYTGGNTGTCEIAARVRYNRLLTQQEKDDAYANIKARMAALTTPIVI